MMYRMLYIWVEGDDDIRFFEEVIKPKFVGRYDWIEVRQYRRETKERLKSFSRLLEI